VDHVFGLDHAPVAALVTVGFAQKRGTPCGIPLTLGVWRCASCAAEVAEPKTAINAQIVMTEGIERRTLIEREARVLALPWRESRFRWPDRAAMA